MNKKRIIIICPGRGSYTRDTANYLFQYGNKAQGHINWMDNQRIKNGKTSLTELDSQPFKAKNHMVGENASSLIYACSLADFLLIDKEKYKIVAITGNSMGWYTSLVISGAIKIENGLHLIEIMGSMMKDGLIGGQLIYPITKDNWQIDNDLYQIVLEEIQKTGAYLSIKLGGYLVIGGRESALKVLSKKLPRIEKYPFIIPYHAAFHTPLLKSISNSALDLIDPSIFMKPSIPLVDGRGKIWSPFSTDPIALMDYTLKHQVLNTYNFSSSISVALKEFCPDKLLLLGPGNSLGGPVGQIIIENNWLGLKSKKDFTKLQAVDPYILSLGIPEQRALL